MKEFLFCLFAWLAFTLVPLAGAATQVRVLTYSSMLDKGGLGEFVKSSALPALQVEFTTSKDFAGILGTLRRLKRQGKLSQVDVVLGLNESHYRTALKEGLIESGKPYEESSFSILVNTDKLPKKDWPKDWKGVGEKLKGKILIQDPRTSEVGLAWLLNATELSNLSLDSAKSVPKKVFSNWSSSFEAFEAGLAPAIWTYSTSAAYFSCAKDPKAAKLANLPLPNYPKDTNFVAVVATSKNQDALKFVDLVLSEKVQKEIWQKNWMFPATYPRQLKTMPECFAKQWLPKDSKTVGSSEPKEILKRLDQWSL